METSENEKNIELFSKRHCNNTKSNKRFTSILIFYIYGLVGIGMCLVLPSEHMQTALFYIGVIFGAIIFAALAENAKTSFAFNIFFGLSFFILFFTLGFRNFSGIDDANYLQIFNEVSQYGWIVAFNTFNHIEPGYLLLNALISFFTHNYLYMQLLTSFIPLALFYHAFKKYKSVISLPMAIFLLSTTIYFQMISVALVRIFIAVSIVFNAYYYIPQKNIKKYTCLILIASMFHYSAIFMLVLMYFAINKDNLTKKAKNFFIFAFLLTPFVFIIVGKYLVPVMGVRYTGYGSINNFSLNIWSLSTIPILVLLLLHYKKFNNEKAKYFKLFLSIFALTSIFSFYDSMVSLGRLIFYTNSALYLAAPMVNKVLTRSSIKRLIFCGLIIFYGFMYIYRTQFTLEIQIPNLFPYKNVFFTL